MLIFVGCVKVFGKIRFSVGHVHFIVKLSFEVLTRGSMYLMKKSED